MNRHLLLSCVCATLCVPPQAQSQETQRPCPSVVGVIASQFVFGVPLTMLERVEVRMCAPGEGATLQLVAWEFKSNKPSLVIDTTDFTIVQFLMVGNVYLIETTGGPRDRVYVVVYEKGKPRLAIQRVTKSKALITTNETAVIITVPNTWTDRAESFTFVLK